MELGSEVGPPLGAGSLVVDVLRLRVEPAASGAAVPEEAAAVDEAAGSEVVELAADSEVVDEAAESDVVDEAAGSKVVLLAAAELEAADRSAVSS
jgi:hypothetical protein